MTTENELEELLMQHLKQHGLLEKWRSLFMETHEGQIYSQINTQERNRLEFYHFLQTGIFMEDEQDQSET